MAFSSALSNLRGSLGSMPMTKLFKFLLIVCALLNLKSLPLFWHFRLLTGFLKHLRTGRSRLRQKVGPTALFQPMITTSRSGFLECDYNLHKSNSTYFSDFDVGRLELLTNLVAHGIDRTRKELAITDGGKAGFAIVLGGVSCNFRREIKPYEGFELWTRILAWDQKWLYVVGHFVRKGAVEPRAYTLQSWRKTSHMKNEENPRANGDGSGHNDAQSERDAKKSPHPAIFCSAIAKYCFKKGRLTIPPERVLRASELLPPKPNDIEAPPVNGTPDTDASSIEGTTIDPAISSVAASLSPNKLGEILSASTTVEVADGAEWTWEKVERERQRGLKIASIYNSLDGLNDEFTADERPVLGRY